MIRVAEARDVGRMLEIYAPYVRDTTVSLEYDPPSLDEFAARFDRISRRYPWIVAEAEGRVTGYAYADLALSRAAYQWDADLSIYLEPAARGEGTGGRLYDCLEAVMAALGYRNLYALVTAGNAPSCRFHERRGYALLGVLDRAGYKFGAWHDLNWYGLHLGGDAAPSGPPKVFRPDGFEALREVGKVLRMA